MPAAQAIADRGASPVLLKGDITHHEGVSDLIERVRQEDRLARPTGARCGVSVFDTIAQCGSGRV